MIGNILVKHVELCFFFALLAKWRPCIAAEEVREKSLAIRLPVSVLSVSFKTSSVIVCRTPWEQAKDARVSNPSGLASWKNG